MTVSPQDRAAIAEAVHRQFKAAGEAHWRKEGYAGVRRDDSRRSRKRLRTVPYLDERADRFDLSGMIGLQTYRHIPDGDALSENH